MAKATIFFYDEKEDRQRRKKLRGESIDHKVEDGFFKIVVDGKTFIIKEENVISLDITED